MIRNFFPFLFLYFSFLTAFANEQLIIEPDMGRAPLLSALSQTKNSAELVMYGFTDPTLRHALIQAKKEGKNLSLLIEPHPYKSEDENEETLQQFHNAHLSIFTPNPEFKLTHEKMLLLDDQHAWIMTFNFTRSSFSRERNFALVIDDKNDIKEINDVFHADAAHQNKEVKENHLIWSPNNSREKITAFIKSADDHIQIYAQDITDYQLVGLLAKAARAGKTVEILLSQPDPERFPNRKLDYLKRADVNIHFSNRYIIHAKVIIIDEKKALLGSINFTASSLNDNRELSVMTENKNVVERLVATFKQDWKDED